MWTEDALTGGPRIIAPGRAERLGPRPGGCPFCRGHEESTPPELDRVVDASGEWSARAVPNLFPLAAEHEVLVLTSRHVTSTRGLSVDEWAGTLELWRRRLRAHAASGGAEGQYTHLFINDGPAAGASLEHVHAQIVVLPRTSAATALVDRVVDPASCVACALARDATEGEVVAREEGLVLRAHPTPRTAEGLLLLPYDHATVLDEVSTDALARMFQIAVRALPDADFNAWLASDAGRGAHWYAEFAPRTSIQAGLELASGIGVSIVEPLEAARRARARLAQEGRGAAVDRGGG